MNKEQEIKLNKAIDKLIGYKVEDKVIITNEHTGRTVHKNAVTEYSWDVECPMNLNKIGKITEIYTDTIPIAYCLAVEKGYGYTYTSDNFRKLGEEE